MAAVASSQTFITDSSGNSYIYVSGEYNDNYYIYKLTPSGTIVKYIQTDYKILSLCNNGGYLYAVYATLGSSQSEAATIVVDVYSTELSFVASASYVVSIPDSSYTSTVNVTLVALNVPDSNYIYIFYWVYYSPENLYQNSNSFDISSLIFYQPSGSSSFNMVYESLISDNYIVGVENNAAYSTILYAIGIDGADYNLVSSTSIPSEYTIHSGGVGTTPVLIGSYLYVPVVPADDYVVDDPYTPSILVYSLPYFNLLYTYLYPETSRDLVLAYSGADYFYVFASGYFPSGATFSNFNKFSLYPNIAPIGDYINIGVSFSGYEVLNVLSQYPYNAKVPVPYSSSAPIS